MRCRSESSRRSIEVDEGWEVCRRTSLKYTICYSSNFKVNAMPDLIFMKILQDMYLWVRKLASRKLPLKYGSHLVEVWTFWSLLLLQLQDAQLSQRDRTAVCVIVFAKSRRLELGDNILQTLQVYLQPLWYNRPENLSNSVKNVKWGLLRRSRSFKVIEVGTNRKPVWYFLLVINSNWHPISYRFGVIAAYCSNFAPMQSLWLKISGRWGRPHQ